jgi:hypothetical protein
MKSMDGAPQRGHKRPLVVRSKFLLLAGPECLVYGGQLELRFDPSRPEVAVEAWPLTEWSVSHGMQGGAELKFRDPDQ